MRRATKSSLRPGFSLIELLVVLIVGAIASSMAMPAVGRMLAETRLHRAATVIASDLQMAHSTAARQRQPVEITLNPSVKSMRVRNYLTPTTIYQDRRFEKTSGLPVSTFATTQTSVVLYPSGLSNESVTITLTAGSKQRVIEMSRAGQIRIRQ